MVEDYYRAHGLPRISIELSQRDDQLNYLHALGQPAPICAVGVDGLPPDARSPWSTARTQAEDLVIKEAHQSLVMRLEPVEHPAEQDEQGSD